MGFAESQLKRKREENRMQNETCLKISHLCKSFPGVRALDDVSVEFYKGEVHALLGENGAGKSTLCKILSGAYSKDSGTLEFDGVEYAGFTPATSKKTGIGMIYQELNLVPYLSVYENIFIGKEIRKKNGISVDKKAMIKKTKEIMDSLEIKIDPTIRVDKLTVAYRQLVEIMKAVSEVVKLLIMDEPTAPLMNQEVEMLFQLIDRLKKQGITIIYISHRIEELYRVADRVTVMRDGQVIQTFNMQEAERSELIKVMVGREIGETYPSKKGLTFGEVVLSADHLCSKKVHDVSLAVRAGEVLGLAGLVGAGRTETARLIFGADHMDSGTIKIRGKEVKINTPADAIKQGVCLIPEDRKGQGVLLKMSVGENITIVKAPEISRFLTINKRKALEISKEYVDAMRIKTPSIEQKTLLLSGGNQQKVALAKWMAVNTDIIIFDEPTRGIDIHAKQEIYEMIDQLRRQGKAIIMISSELPELIGMSNRIVVLYEGHYSGEITREEDMTQEKILDLASGGGVL